MSTGNSRYDVWKDYAVNRIDDSWVYTEKYPSRPTSREMEEFIAKFKAIMDAENRTYPPYFMLPALELAYKTLSPEEKKAVLKAAEEECGTFYHPEQALRMVPIFSHHIQNVLKSKQQEG